ncbi:hypothetical protein MTO96_028947 [Rhipicephalus appendiculatus]
MVKVETTLGTQAPACRSAEGTAGVKHTGKDYIKHRLRFSGNSAGGKCSRSKCNAELQSSDPSVTRLDARNMGAGSCPNSTPSFNANKTPSGTTGHLKREEVQRRR